MDINILKRKGIEGALFGSNRDEIRSNFTCPLTSFKAQAWDVIESDYYDDAFLRLSYDEELKLSNIGILPHGSVYFDGCKLDVKNLKTLLNKLKSLGFKFGKIEQGYYFDELGLCISYEGKFVTAIELYMGKYEDLLQVTLSRASAYYSE
ncbi:MAG: hypothetical protein JXR16_08100 [Bermanella sp.]